jgi:DNA-binding transcriptional MerR regulator
MVAEKMLVEHFDAIPYMKAFYEHVSAGRGLETFLASNQKPVFETIDIREPNADAAEPVIKQAKENQRQMIKLELQAKGVEAEEIEQFIDLTESAGKLTERANKAKATLTTNHKAAVAQMMEQEEAAIQQQEAQQAAVNKQVAQMFEKNDFGGLSIPVADLKLFKDAVFNVDGQGKSLIQHKREKLTLAQQLFIDYIVLKDFKGIGTPKAPQQSKQFVFQKANKENDVRGGGRIRGAGSMEHAQFDIKDLSKLNLKLKT